MNKEAFTSILECALLSYDGMSKQEILKEFEVSEQVVDIGINLCNYLKGKVIK